MTVKNANAKSWVLNDQAGRRYSAGDVVAFSAVSNQNLTLGTAASVNLSGNVTGGVGAYHFVVSADGQLPSGLSLAPTTGIISGIPDKVETQTPEVTVADTIADALEQDWLARKNGAGVQWAHDFRDPAEVTKWIARDGAGGLQYDSDGVLCVRRIVTDGITGGACLELLVPTNGTMGTRWARPFQPMPGDVGYVSDGTWRTVDIAYDWKDYGYQFRRGCYGHPDHWEEASGTGIDGLNFIGHDFWIQFRYKVSSSCFSPSQTEGLSGKLAFVDVAVGGAGNQELVVQSPIYGSKRFTMYTNFGSRSNSSLNAGQSSADLAGSYQPGGEYAATCNYAGNFASCWQWPTDEWVTVLMHITPGHDNGSGDNPDMASTGNYKDTGIEVWIARYGDTEYTKIWEKMDYVWSYGSPYGNPNGFNCFVASTYMNNVASAVSWYRRFDQVIFSKNFIPCPKVYA